MQDKFDKKNDEKGEEKDKDKEEGEIPEGDSEVKKVKYPLKTNRLSHKIGFFLQCKLNYVFRKNQEKKKSWTFSGNPL